MQRCFQLVFFSMGAALAFSHGVKSLAEVAPESVHFLHDSAPSDVSDSDVSDVEALKKAKLTTTPAEVVQPPFPGRASVAPPQGDRPITVELIRSEENLSPSAVTQQAQSVPKIVQSELEVPVVESQGADSSTPTAPPAEANPPFPRVTEADPTVPTLPNGQPYKPQGSAKPGAAPESLNPDPNPLQFPTDPEEVRLRGIQPITLQQAIELAERNNRELQIAQLQLERSRFGLRQAQAALYPNLDFQAGITNSRSAGGGLSRSQTFPFSSGNTANTLLSGGLTLSYDLFTSGLRPAQIQAAERQLRSDELALEAAREQLRLDVAGDYYNLQEADEAVRINLAAVRNNETSLKDAQALEQAGLGTRFDVLRAEVQLANSQQQLTAAIAQQQVQRRQLAQRLSIPQGIDLAAADEVQVAGKWELPLEESIILAYKNRAELEQQLVQRELADQQRRAALAALGPRITLSAQYDLLDRFSDGVGVSDGYSLQAAVRWNLFDGGAAKAAAAQQERNMRISETRFADVRNQIRFQVEQAYASLQSNLKNIETTNLALDQAREALRLARLRFQAGVGTQTEVINAETDLTRAEGNRLTAILGYNRALSSLRRAITNLSPVPSASSTPAP